jgi:hypothetical protein
MHLKSCRVPCIPALPWRDYSHIGNIPLVQWYNHEHRNLAIASSLQPQRHDGLHQAILAQFSAVYEVARAKNPLRWKDTKMSD